MSLGRVVRMIGGFYFVDSLTEAKLVECAIRGRLKLKSEGILVGDLVDFCIEANGRGVIDEIKPRESTLTRPYVANVNLLVLVFAHCNPDPIPRLIDKFLVLAELSRIPYLIVFNKTDLVGKGKADKLANIYRNYGYNVLNACVRSHLGQRKLASAISGKIAVFSGPSGVGKSALLNLLKPGLQLRTGEVSEKIGRGKHTTREVQLLKIKPGSYVADTPGFSQISLESIRPEELAPCFIEFHEFLGQCRFSSCLHDSEPGCGVKTAVAEGKITNDRYQSYLELLGEIKGLWENRYR